MSVTFAELIEARAEDDDPALWFEEQSWTWREVVSEARARADLAATYRRDGEPWHIGVFCENTADHLFWFLACGLSGATYVGLNPTRRGSDLARDIEHTQCCVVVYDEARAELLPDGNFDTLDAARGSTNTMLIVQADGRRADLDTTTILSLIFTSGTTAAPKAVICTQGRMGRIALTQVERRGLTKADVFYVVMPMFHSNALMAGIAPAVATGGTIVLRRKFSASGFLPDVRRYGVTFFNYVGKPLHYVLTTPEQPDDADNTLRLAFGNEARIADVEAFSRRFDCQVIDGFGSSEGEIQIVRTPDTPRGALGVASDTTLVVDPETRLECPRATYDDQGRVLNADEATGEIVNTIGGQLFEGYWNNPEAEAARVRDGWSFSGDLAWRDEAGFFWFAGRSSDWLRVDGENLAAAPIERLLERYEQFVGVAVVATPDEVTGDQVHAFAELAAGEVFDPTAFADFLSAQPDLGTKWAPSLLTLIDELPRTPTNKVIKRAISDLPPPGPGRAYRRRDGVYEPQITSH